MAVFPVKQWDDDDDADKGFYAIWTTESDCFVGMNLKREDVVKYFVDMAADDARERTESLLDQMEGLEEPPKRMRRSFYREPDMTFGQRLERHREMEGNIRDNDEINALVRKKLEELGR